MNPNGLILFLKFPEKGKIKTRLAKTLGNDLTFGLYECFIQDLLEKLEHQNYDIHLFITPAEQILNMRHWMGHTHWFHPQEGEDLGERMKNAFVKMFQLPYERCIIMGSDYPDIPRHVPHQALECLNTIKTVIGPSKDGGYYLLGFQRDHFCKAVFQQVSWSTKDVFQQTMTILNQQNLFPKIFPQGQDIDEFSDLLQLIHRYADKSRSFYHSHTMEFLRTHQEEINQMNQPLV